MSKKDKTLDEILKENVSGMSGEEQSEYFNRYFAAWAEQERPERERFDRWLKARGLTRRTIPKEWNWAYLPEDVKH